MTDLGYSMPQASLPHLLLHPPWGSKKQLMREASRRLESLGRKNMELKFALDDAQEALEAILELVEDKAPDDELLFAIQGWAQTVKKQDAK